MKEMLILIPAIPFAAFAIQVFVGRKLPRGGDWVSTSAIFASFVISLVVFVNVIGELNPMNNVLETANNWFFTWLPLRSETNGVDIGVMADNMTAIMLLMVSGCATLIHIFSTWYMHGEVRYSRFFAYLSLFTGSMLGLVVSDNLLTLFIFWELMGFCSYSLIGFYFERESAVRANIKAFMTTRIGDTCLFVGMLIIWANVGSLRFSEIYQAVGSGVFEKAFFESGFSAATIGTVAGILVLMGTIGKSAQFPLQVWLPDAMEGPTPVSALIHAATMVAAGVYLILRMFPLLQAGDVLVVVAYVGAITAFLSSLIAITQNDIKGVLAYSTISQLGYMVLGVGVGAYAAAFMHLVTHALFKACLFMSSGSVIHGIHTQDMREMGGLRKKMPFTFTAMLVATCAIAGFPFFSGFVSKDMILMYTLQFGYFENPTHMALPILGFTAAAVTAFYMFRLIFMTFFGEPRDKHKYDHVHVEKFSELNRWPPLVILAFMSLAVFFSGSLTGIFTGDTGDQILGPWNDWFKKVVTLPSGLTYPENDMHTAHSIAMYTSIAIAVLGTAFSSLFYLFKKLNPESFRKAFSWVYTVLINKYYFDWFYIEIIIKKIYMPVADFFGFVDMDLYDKYCIDGWFNVAQGGYSAAQIVDDGIIDYFLVDGAGRSASVFGSSVRFIQNGQVQTYLAIGIGISVTAVMAVLMI